MSNGQIKSNKEMIMYIMKKVDKIDDRFEDGSKKIASNRTDIKNLKWVIGATWAGLLAFGGWILRIIR